MGWGSEDSVQYEQMDDTPWITQGREIADVGGKGILANANNVNVFDQQTNADIDARNNAIYQRAKQDAADTYRNTMNKYAAQSYNRFGGTNNTPSAYITDQYNRDWQRQQDNLAYEKAMNYDTLKDKELQRRYNTLNMYQTLYNMGQTPHQLDLANWGIRNKNIEAATNASAASSAGSQLNAMNWLNSLANLAQVGYGIYSGDIGSVTSGASGIYGSNANSILNGSNNLTSINGVI